MDVRFCENYVNRLQSVVSQYDWEPASKLANALRTVWKNKQRVFFCGNGGSAGNAIHLANDFLYGAGIKNGKGIRVEALSANPAVLTCLANDLGYEMIFSEQLNVKANKNDILIVFELID